MSTSTISGQDDHDLILAYQNGDSSAVDVLLEKYKPLVRKKARTLYLIGGENDDLIQEGMIALFKAIRAFDPKMDSSFTAFAEKCIEHKLYNVIKGANRMKNTPLNTYISLYSPLSGSDGESSPKTLADTLLPNELINPEDILIDQENVTDIRSAIEQKLSPFERQVAGLYIDGCTCQQIADSLDKTPKSIDNALQRIKKKIKPDGDRVFTNKKTVCS